MKKDAEKAKSKEVATDTQPEATKSMAANEEVK